MLYKPVLLPSVKEFLLLFQRNLLCCILPYKRTVCEGKNGFCEFCLMNTVSLSLDKCCKLVFLISY